MGLTSVGAVLRSLANEHTRIGAAVADDTWFEGQLANIAESAARLSEYAAERPLIFAGFALPRKTKPDDAIVHNTTLGALIFARAVNQEARLERALETASRHPLLRPGVTLARSSSAVSGEARLTDIVTNPHDDRSAFYVSLGRRLAFLHPLDDGQKSSAPNSLLVGCLNLGPRLDDAVVLYQAAGFGLAVRSALLSDYRARVDANRECHLTFHRDIAVSRDEPGMNYPIFGAHGPDSSVGLRPPVATSSRSGHSGRSVLLGRRGSLKTGRCIPYHSYPAGREE